MIVFLKRMFTVFFDRVNPVSTVAKPRCMIKTNAVAINIQRLFTVNMASPAVMPADATAAEMLSTTIVAEGESIKKILSS
jgi:hypothetical protein